MSLAAGRQFFKLEALGNDFVLIDARRDRVDLDEQAITALANRRTGVGFDQLLVIETAQNGAWAGVSIFNADASPAEQCGNGMRAIAAWLDRDGRLDCHRRLETPAGDVILYPAVDAVYRTELPGPSFIDPPWPALKPPPLPEAALDCELLSTGNPHLVIVWPQPPGAEALALVAAAFDADAQWRNRVNIGLMHVCADHSVELRVHERGAGPTPACGSGACAAAAVAIKRGLGMPPLAIRQPGGVLVVDWMPGDDRICLTGPARVVFEGNIA
ncbi:MAG: diaminopimelate epimerase [Wenzhouxiangellaceae bacterium]|nr:diaminopimelate epimerase [Wenzhouxiangellaceae bacterium]